MNKEQLQAKLEELEDEAEKLRYELDNFELDEDKYVKQYREMIDDCTGVVEIMGLKYTASHILEQIDKIAFDCGLHDYVDSLEKEETEEYKEVEQELSEIEAEIESLKEKLKQ